MTGLNRNTVNRFLHAIRERLAEFGLRLLEREIGELEGSLHVAVPDPAARAASTNRACSASNTS